jgi:Leucine-rich repeat (LRR) protein
MSEREFDPFKTRPGTAGIKQEEHKPVKEDGLAYAARMMQHKHQQQMNEENRLQVNQQFDYTRGQQQQQPEYQPRFPDMPTSSSFRLSPPPNSASSPYHRGNRYNDDTKHNSLLGQPQQQQQYKQQYQPNKNNSINGNRNWNNGVSMGGDVTKTENIDVSNRGISSLDDVLLGNQVSRVLNASSNSLLRLRPFPSTWTNSLQVLDLSENRLVMLKVDTFKTLHSLKVLDLSNNSLSSLPHLFHSNSKLEVFNVSKNNLSVLNVELLGNNINNLIELDVSENSLTNVPNVMGCTKLQVLNMRMNLISSIPLTFASNVNNLRVLKADVNAFNRLQDFIPGLRSNNGHLEDIDVRNNPFVAIVEEMGADYRPIVSSVVPTLISINGKRVNEQIKKLGQSLLNNNNGNIRSYDDLLHSCKTPMGRGSGNRGSSDGNRITRRPLPSSPAAGSVQAKQWALKMLQSQQEDVINGSDDGGRRTFSSSNSIIRHNPKHRQQMRQIQRMNSSSSPTTTSPLRRRLPITTIQQSTLSSTVASNLQEQPLGTLVNVTKEVTRLRQEVSAMRKYVRHWIQKEAAERNRSSIAIQATFRGWSIRKLLRKHSSTYRTAQRRRMRRLLEMQ